jgi:hypothetical protein
MKLNYVLILFSIILSVFLVSYADGQDTNSAMVTSGLSGQVDIAYGHGNQKTKTKHPKMRKNKD